MLVGVGYFKLNLTIWSQGRHTMQRSIFNNMDSAKYKEVDEVILENKVHQQTCFAILPFRWNKKKLS